MVQTRKQHAYEAIREQMRAGKLLPGDRLAEVSLSRAIRVSRGPLREAINQLASEGLVQQVPGMGAYVRRPDVVEINDIYDTREALESFAAERATGLLTPSDLEQLEDLCAEMHASVKRYRDQDAWGDDDRRALLAADVTFHAVIAQTCGNGRIVKLLDDFRLLQRMLAYSDRLGPVSSLETRSWAWGEHVRILRALQAGDPVAARASMAAHIQTSKRNALAAYGALQGRGPSE